MWHYVASRKKVSHRQEKDDTNRSANDSMEPLPKEDVLELLHTHVLELIVIDPFWRFLVFLKFLLPLCLIHRWKNSVRFPPHHRKSWLREASMASNNNNCKNRGAHCSQPCTHELLFPSNNKLFIDDVEHRRVVGKFVLWHCFGRQQSFLDWLKIHAFQK